MAVGQISENPASNAVNRPTVTQVRDQDIQNKLRLYGIFNAFSAGKFPSNKQIDVALTSAVESDMLTNPSEKLSEEGRQLVKDLRDVIDSAKLLLLKKNYNEELQNFLYHTMRAAATPDARNIDAPVSQDRAKEHGNETLNGLRTLGRLVLTNGQFRKILEDITLLIRDMAADGASKATQKLRPDQERLEQIDHPAPDDTWHEAAPSVGEMKKSLKSSIGTRQRPTPQGTDDASSQGFTTSGAGDASNEAAGRPERQTQDGAKDRTIAYLKTKVHQERRDKAIERLKKMVVEIQRHEDYNDAINTLISISEEYVHHTKRIARDTHREVKRSVDDSNFQKARLELKTLLENFADGTSMDDMLDALDDLIVDADNDEEFSNWAKSVDRFVRKCLQEEGYILKDESTEEWNNLSDHGNHLLNERYKQHTDRLTEEVNRWLDYMANDPDSVDFGNKFQKLFVDLGQDQSGNIVFKKHLLSDVADVIIPGFFENVRYVPIPRIEVKDASMDAVVENLVLESENLMPNLLEIQADTFWRFGRKSIQNRSKHRFFVHASQIQCDLKDVAYWINKKQGFPSISDTGVMDVLLGGEGMSFDMRLVNADNRHSTRIFKVESLTVRLKNLNITLKKSNHKLLFTFFKPILMAVIKPAIVKAVETKIRNSFDKLDEQLWLIQNEYNKAKEAATNQPPEETENMVNMYIHAIQRRFTEMKAQAKRKTPDKVNVATTMEGSMFPNIHFPGAVSADAAKYREMARQGNEWRSPVFDIGNAKAQSAIPSPKKITRKSPQQNSRATLNERKQPGSSSSNEHAGSDFPGTDSTRANMYQPRMSTAADSMRTAVDHDDMGTDNLGKHNVTSSPLDRDIKTSL